MIQAPSHILSSTIMLRFGLTTQVPEDLISIGKITLIASTTTNGSRATTGHSEETNVHSLGTTFTPQIVF